MLNTKRHNHKLAGIILIILSSFLAFKNLYVIYDYRVHPNVLRLFWIPEWILFIQAIIGLIGIVIGLLIYKKKLKILTGYLISGLLWLIGFMTEIIILN
jgi:hypothetical protein